MLTRTVYQAGNVSDSWLTVSILRELYVYIVYILVVLCDQIVIDVL